MTVWCVENLHRLPCEIHAPTSALVAAMLCHAQVLEQRERDREWAAGGSL